MPVLVYMNTDAFASLGALPEIGRFPVLESFLTSPLPWCVTGCLRDMQVWNRSPGFLGWRFEMQWNELLQLITFLYTESHSWDLSTYTQSQSLVAKLVTCCCWPSTCVITSCPGWWPCQHEARVWLTQQLPLDGSCKLVSSTWLLSCLWASTVPRLGRAVLPKVFWSLLGANLCL